MPKLIRVACLLWTGGTGGAERHVYDLVTALPRERFAPTVCFLAQAQAYGQLLAQAGVPFQEIGMRSGYDARGAFRLVRWLRESRFDIIHDHISTRWAPTAIGLGIPGAKIVSTEHNGFLIEGCSRWEHMWLCLNALFTKQHIAVSQAIQTVLVQDLGIQSDHVQVIPNFVDTERFEAVSATEAWNVRRSLGMPDGAMVLISIGRLEEEKRFECLIELLLPLFRTRDDLYLLIVGEGPLETELRAQIVAAGMEARMCLLGSRFDVPQLLKAADIFVLVSRVESFGIVALEAMLAGLPVVAVRVGGLGELIVPDVTGTLLDEAHMADFARTVALLLDDPARRKQMGKAGRKRALDHFERSKVVNRIVQTYDRVLTEQRA